MRTGRDPSSNLVNTDSVNLEIEVLSINEIPFMTSVVPIYNISSPETVIGHGTIPWFFLTVFFDTNSVNDGHADNLT